MSLPIHYMSSALIRSCGRQIIGLKWHHKQGLLCHLSFARSHTTPPNNYLNIKATKRYPSRAQDNRVDHTSSVISYNLSEELMIDKAQKLVETFEEYAIETELPEDLAGEAVMISSKDKTHKSTVIDPEKPFRNILLFREGAIVFWGVPYEQQKEVLSALSPLKRVPYSNDIIQNEREDLNFSLEKGISKSRLKRDSIQISLEQDTRLVRLDQFTVSHAMALSVKLGVWEAILEEYIESIEWITGLIKRGEKVTMSRRQVFMKTGEIYQLKHRINLSSDLLDLPDVYWDRPDQEELFLSLASYLNMKKRISVINEKLNHCCELMNLLSNDMNNKHHVRLEWMIIVLIMVEVSFEILRFLEDEK